MRVPRLFLDKERIPLSPFETIPLLPTEQNYLINVLRLPHQASVQILDGKGHIMDAVLLYEGQNLPCFQIKNIQEQISSPQVKITLMMGLIKHDKMELVIQKVTELGVSKIILVQCERSVVHLDENRAIHRIKRFQDIARQAAQQSKRMDIPVIEPLVSFQELLNQSQIGTKIFFWEEPLGMTLHDIFVSPSSGEVCLFIGPEGGFSHREVHMAKEAGWHICSLGSQILRSETAAIAAVAIVRYLLFP